jgi:hypothetical protein
MTEVTAPNTQTQINTRPAFFRGTDGVYKKIDSPWGTYYTKIPDPKGNPKPKELDEFHVNENFCKLPGNLLQAIITLFRHYLKEETKHPPHKYTESTTEVQVCLLRNEVNTDEWKVVVPKQVVGSVTVDATHAESCDILTGEEYNIFPPIGWVYAGSVHSHHTMPPFWSSRDDEGELGNPGMHCTVGYLTKDSFSICTSIVLNKKRYILDPKICLDLSLCSNITSKPHDKNKSIKAKMPSSLISDKVHNYITEENHKYSYNQPLYGNSYKGTWYNNWVNKLEKKQTSWENFDSVPTYNYDKGYYENTYYSDNQVISGELVDELNALTEQLSRLYSYRLYSTNLTPSQMDAYAEITRHLTKIFDAVSYCEGFELAIISALQKSFQLDINEKISSFIEKIES